MVPANRTQFKGFILRKLGEPVVKVNVDDTQVEDCIDRSLQFFTEYHSDGSRLSYAKIQVTQDMISAGGFPMPTNVIGAVEIFNYGGMYSSTNFFNISYQIALNDLYSLTAQSIVPYYMAFQHIELLEQLLVGTKPIRWNRHEGFLHLDADWNQLPVGTWLIVKCYQALPPDEFPSVWADWWLQDYAEAEVGCQWGKNLSKFKNVQMPGGVMFNGDEILQRYAEQKEKLEDQMIGRYAAPAQGFMG